MAKRADHNLLKYMKTHVIWHKKAECKKKKIMKTFSCISSFYIV